MGLSKIDIEWFRGAADKVTLDLGGKSTVVYGTNGSGKSSFVDAIEYILNDGRIGHLTHEYSGKKQEKGVINTHKPTLKPTSATIALTTGETVAANIKTNGTHAKTGTADAIVAAWDYRRVVLRQDEVAAFISSAKGAKYSALLPLLGLAPLEQAAENVRQLARQMEKIADVGQKRAATKHAIEEVQARFGSVAKASDKLKQLWTVYRSADPMPSDAIACTHLADAITSRIGALSADAQRHVAISAFGRVKIEDAIADVRATASALATTAASLVDEKLTLLDAASRIVAAGAGASTITCPACGRDILMSELATHLEAESRKLAEARKTVDSYKRAINALSDGFATLRTAFGDRAVRTWAQQHHSKLHAQASAHFASRTPAALRAKYDNDELNLLETNVLPLVVQGRAFAADRPPEADQLVRDHDAVRAIQALIASERDREVVESTDRLLEWLGAIEANIRELIHHRSDSVIDEISSDVQRMWSILHPGEAIDNVRLRHPDETDKAIDIELSFHGIPLKSPRLTLSEGYRNSLGLCVFLSMAKRSDEKTPVVLDDVVVSLDRNHRGMIVDLLEKEFANRQVLVLTHDREWYVELRQRLDDKQWNFRTLRPYGAPADGINWSTKSSTFDDARAFVEKDPDVAGNTVRKIMDIELAARVEKLQVKLPYLHGYKNDHRMAHEFLEALVSAAKKAFQVKKDNTYSAAEDAVQLLKDADRLLIAWGNRASHTFDVVRPEAERLLEVCEKALAVFDCSSCNKPVYRFDDSNETQQCSCGTLRWRYGKLS